MSTIVILGSSSFVAGHLIDGLKTSSYEVIGLQRDPQKNSHGIPLIEWSLGDPIPETVLQKALWVISCAHSFENHQLSVEGHEKILKQMNEFKLAKCIFISSYSAFADAPGGYGQAKAKIEDLFLNKGHYIVRPGLIIGDGGMFATLMKNISRLPIVPIIGFGNAPIFYIGVKDLCHFLIKIVQSRPNKYAFNLFCKNPTNQIELARAIKTAAQKRLLYLRLPVLFFEIVIWTYDKLNLKSPITRDNLEGYRRNTKEVRSSDIDYFKFTKTDSIVKMLELAP